MDEFKTSMIWRAVWRAGLLSSLSGHQLKGCWLGCGGQSAVRSAVSPGSFSMGGGGGGGRGRSWVRRGRGGLEGPVVKLGGSSDKRGSPPFRRGDLKGLAVSPRRCFRWTGKGLVSRGVPGIRPPWDTHTQYGARGRYKLTYNNRDL